ncbi:MAG: hypothetical protein NUV52_04450 [Candidatus Roizmanbacteria bacterium]|nr:hypothetical protein [Candidatus Roizmanbacteria bacterium]
MNDQKISHQDDVKSNINPMVVAVAGAAVGAGIVVAGVVLSDKKNREKIAQTAATVRDDVAHFVTKTQKQVDAEKRTLEKKILADKIKVKKVVASAKNSLDKTTKKVNNAVKSL